MAPPERPAAARAARRRTTSTPAGGLPHARAQQALFDPRGGAAPVRRNHRCGRLRPARLVGVRRRAECDRRARAGGLERAPWCASWRTTASPTPRWTPRWPIPPRRRPRPGRGVWTPPLVVSDAEWRRLEAGLIQRSTLMDAVLTDLYGRAMITDGLLPPELVYLHPATSGPRTASSAGRHQLFFHAVDVCRAADGGSESTPTGPRRRRVPAMQWPTGGSSPGCCPTCSGAAGRAVSACRRRCGWRCRAAPEPGGGAGGRGAQPRHPFGDLLRPGDAGLRTGRPAGGERRPDHPARPAVDAVDGHLEPVDVVVRRVDAESADPLDLRADSRLGVVGLTEVLRAARSPSSTRSAAASWRAPGCCRSCRI